MSEPTRTQLLAYIATLEDQLVGVCAHRDRLTIYERQWKEQQEVIRSSTMDDTLHIRMTINVDGRYNSRDCVLSLSEIRQSVLGPSMISQRVVNYYHAMVQAIKAAKRPDHGREDVS